MEPILRSAQVLKQEAEDIGFEGKDILEYVKEQQKLDREERAAWREEKKRADELQAEEKRRADEIRFAQIEAAKEQAKIEAAKEQAKIEAEAAKEQAKLEAEKELKIKEMELQAQAQVTASSATTPPPRNKDAKSPKLPSFIDEKDELDSYLLRFERYAENASWEKDTWAIKLSALLTGRAMDVYTRMSDADASDYDKLKKALLTRYNYTEDGYRKRFREATPETEETPDQFVIRLKNYLAKWLELSGSSPQNFDALVDLIVKEQFINACSEDLAMYLLERGPKDLVELTTWAQKYLIAHKEQLGKNKAIVQPRHVDQKKTTQSKPDSSQGRQRSLQCYRCRGFGHRQSECGTKISPGKDQKGSSTPVSQSSLKKTRAMVAQLDEDGEKAFTCVEVEGTRSRSNSKKSGTEGSTNSDRAVYSAVCRAQSNDGQTYVGVGKLNGRPVKVLRDTGCTGMIVDRALVPEVLVIPGSSGSLQMVDHTLIDVPLANVYLDSPYYKGHCRVMCVSSPVYPVIIGNVRGARRMLPDPDWKAEDQPGVRARTSGGDKDKDNEDNQGGDIPAWMFRRSNQKTEKSAPKERDSKKKPVQPKEIDDRAKRNVKVKEGTTDEKCVAGPVVTRAQAKKSDKVHPLKVKEAMSSVDKSTIENLQKDSTLKKCFDRIGKPIIRENYVGEFYKKNGLLYRKHQETKTGRSFNQLVVPKELRRQVMSVNHESAFSGHLGAKKTEVRILPNFFWPGLRQDVIRFCRSCDVCQRTVKRGSVKKVPLGSMPLIDTPFKRVAVDIVGPIAPPSEAGHRYILTLVDYATRYPEAVPLKKITTEAVAEALLDIYSRVGIPEEVLTDQGTQFMSECMQEVSRLLSIKGLTSTPYHPICNGLVERWNGTLKSMIKRLCQDQPKQWHRLINPVLFACREVPQESTGFSPFQLLYGRSVRGPGTILKELWTKEVNIPEVKSSYEYVTELRERLEDSLKLAQEELEKSQKRYKRHYDRKAKPRRLEVGDRVLILLPTDSNKLLMQWRGPYTVESRVGANDYRVKVGSKTKTYHVNMLKKYISREPEENVVPVDDTDGATVSVAGVIHQDVDPELGEVPDLEGYRQREGVRDVKLGDELPEDQRRVLKDLVRRYPDVFTDMPGETDVIQHQIRLTDDTPIRCKPYPLPYAMREELRNEVDTMLEMGVVRPSTSPYASPIVMVKKKDGSNRVCVDFRKLNKITEVDPEPMTTAEDLFRRLSGKKYLSKIDLTKGYWQIPVAPEDVHKTAFVTPDGQYEFTRMPFGMVNSGATLVRGLRKILEGMPGVGSYVDDIVIYSDSWEDHIKTLKELFGRLRKARITARPTKCLLGASRMEFLGHQVGGDVITPSRDNLEKVRNTPRPTTKKQVRSFLGLVGYYRDHIPAFAEISAPLTDLLKKGKAEHIQWSEAQERAYSLLKEYLLQEPVLKLPDLSKPFVLRTDASGVGVAAVLLQENDGKLYPVGYASKKLNLTEARYPIIEKECLAVVWGIKRFKLYLAGRRFTLQTDHKPLKYLKDASYQNDRVFRWAVAVQEYSFRVEDIPGRENIGADFLSRTGYSC